MNEKRSGRGSISWGWFVMTGVILYLMVVL